MNFRCHSAAYALAVAAIVIALYPGLSQGKTIDKILAIVDDRVITLADYDFFLRGLDGAAMADGVIDERALRQLVEDKLMAIEAGRRGIEVPDGEVEESIEEFKTQNAMSGADFETFLQDDGLDLKQFRAMVRERLLISHLVSMDVDAKVLIADQEVEEYYLIHKGDFLDSPEYVELKAIFLLLREESSITEITDMKRRALRIAAMLRDGADFDHLVDEYSDEPLKSHRGVLGRFPRGALIAKLDEKAFSMKKGEISEPVWVGRGAFILHLIDRTVETYIPLEQVKGRIYDTLFKQKREKIFNDWIKALREKSSVRILLQ